MYKTYEEWKELNCFVMLGQKSYLRSEQGNALFHINQVQEHIDKDTRFMMQLEAECTDPNQ